MTNLNFRCPNCDYIITEKDFETSDVILSHLKEIFRKNEQDYIADLKDNWIKEYEKAKEAEIQKRILEEKIAVEKVKQVQIDQLLEEKNKLEAKINSFDLTLENKVLEKTQQIINENNQKIAALNELIAQQKQDITKYENEIENVKKNIQIEVLKREQTLLEQFANEKEKLQKQNEQIVIEKNQLEAEIKSFELSLENKVLEKTQQIINENNQKIAALNELIAQQKQDITKYENEIENVKKNIQIEVLKREQELAEKFSKEKDELEKVIQELEKANLLNKVIQNKTKGETFEHDVEGELRKSFEPDDIIEKITSQDKKADYLQKVRVDDTVIGKIVYEVKNAEWSQTWEKKLTEDMAKQESKYGILVATSFNNKFHGIPFKRSDYNPNIYLCDSESFIFVGQIIRTLIKIEHRLSQKDTKDANEAIQNFIEWRDIQLPKFNKIFEDSFAQITKSEDSIIKRVAEISKAREKLYSNWLNNIKMYLEKIKF